MAEAPFLFTATPQAKLELAELFPDRRIRENLTRVCDPNYAFVVTATKGKERERITTTGQLLNQFAGHEHRLGMFVELADKVHALHRSEKSFLHPTKLREVLFAPAVLKMPDYFSGSDQKPGAVLFFDPIERNYVANVASFNRTIGRLHRCVPAQFGDLAMGAIALRRALQGFVSALAQFSIHEDGHIVDANGGIVEDPQRQAILERQLLTLRHEFSLSEAEQGFLLKVREDCRAERYRYDRQVRAAKPEAWGEHLYWTFVAGSAPLRPMAITRSNLIFGAQIALVFEMFGPQAHLFELQETLARFNEKVPDASLFFEAVRGYLRNYFKSLRFDQNRNLAG